MIFYLVGGISQNFRGEIKKFFLSKSCPLSMPYKVTHKRRPSKTTASPTLGFPPHFGSQKSPFPEVKSHQKLSEKICPIIVPNIAPKYHVPMINSFRATAPPPSILIFWGKNPFFLDLGNKKNFNRHSH